MERPIVRDVMFLSQKCMDALPEDTGIGKDLEDTLRAHSEHCVGMAANMIGFRKRIIIIGLRAGDSLVMYNPLICRKEKPYKTKEGCLSLEGMREVTRYEKIEVEYRGADWKKHRTAYIGFLAQIIQHEIDHTNGIPV